MIEDSLRNLRSWSMRRWWFALLGALATTVAIGVPTALIPNPVFGRAVPPTWWSVPVLAVTAILSGLLIATYVAEPDTETVVRPSAGDQRGSLVGGLLAFFAVGCPVCNKLVLVALGSSGAMTWFAPAQPLLAIASIVVLVVALRKRLAGADSCPIDIDNADPGLTMTRGQ